MNNQIDQALSPTALIPSSLQMRLKEQLKIYLEYREMTAAELARKAGVSKQVISLWLGGSEPRRISQLKKVAKVLDVTIDTLVFGDGISNEDQKTTELDALLGDKWISGLFEVKFRRIKRGK